MAITSLKHTKWLFNETFTSCTVEPDATINFKSNNVDYTRFDLMINPSAQSVFVIQYINDDTSVTAYSTVGWGNQEYRTITIVDGDDVENATLIAFLEANAVQLEYDLVEPETPVEPEAPEDKPLRFQETNTNLNIYENLSAKDYEALEKQEHALYIVKNVGIYKGTNLIARNEDITKLGLEKVLNLYIRNESVAEVTNLTDAIIQFNDTVNLPLGSWDINFNTSNNYNDNGYWGEIRISTDYMNTDQTMIQYGYISSKTEDSTTWSYLTVYQNGQWTDRAYQTISITGGDEVQDSDLIEALVSNSSISMPQNNKYQLNVYEISSLDEFHLIKKDPNAFYIVANNGVYKGSVLIASSTSEDNLDDAMLVYYLQEDDSFESVETFHRLKNGHYSCIAAEDGTIVYQNLFSESENTIICNRFLGFANGNNAHEDENGFDGCGQIYYRLRYDPNTDTASYTSYIVQNNSVFPNPNLNNTNGIKEISEPLETVLINNTLYSVTPIAGDHIYIDSDNAINLNLPAVTKSFTYGNISSMANASFTKEDFDKLRYHASVLGFTSYQGSTKAAAYMFKPVVSTLDTIDGATVETMELVCDSTPKMRLILTFNGSTNTVTSSWSQETSVDETTIQDMIDSAISAALQGDY